MLIGLTDLEGRPVPLTDFTIGTVVKHKLYAYRGVVVAYDPSCTAGDTWYQSNKTKPSRDQPWYHVLVHDSGGLSTYVAQENLLPDDSGESVNHPRIDSYFSEFIDGRYRAHSPSSALIPGTRNSEAHFIFGTANALRTAQTQMSCSASLHALQHQFTHQCTCCCAQDFNERVDQSDGGLP